MTKEAEKMPKAATRPAVMPKPAPSRYPLRRPKDRMTKAAGKVPSARPRLNRLTGSVTSAGSEESCCPTNPPSEMTIGGLAAPRACAAVSTNILRLAIVWSVMCALLQSCLDNRAGPIQLAPGNVCKSPPSPAALYRFQRDTRSFAHRDARR